MMDPRRMLEGYLARRSRRSATDNPPRDPFLYGPDTQDETDLGDGVAVVLDTLYEGNNWKWELTYRTPEYKATVRDLSALMIGNNLWGQDLRKWIPLRPGRYWIGDGSALYPLEDAKLSGRIRKFSCRLRIHWKRRVPGYRNRVWQCPYCLKLKMRFPHMPGSVAIGFSDEFYALEQDLLCKNFDDARVPSGPGKPAWVEVGVRQVAPRRYVGSLDDAIEKLV